MKRLGLTKPMWKISVAGLSMRVDCTPSGIIARCLGKCCTSTFWPGKAAPNAAGYCYYHASDKGCRLTMQQRPITCLLYPLKFMNKAAEPLYRATIIRHFRTPVICKGNIDAIDTPLVVLFKNTLTYLFGEKQYAKMLNAVKQGHQHVTVEVPGAIYRACKKENKWEEKNQIPQPRRVLW